MIEIESATLGRSAAVASILRILPQWFGIEEATQGYIRAAGDEPTVLAVDTQRDRLPVGCLTLLRHSDDAAEILVMGVRPEYHRQGIGRRLLEAAEASLRADGVTFLQVKTLSDRHPDPGYQQTRAFYRAMGFRVLQEFPELWGAEHPCWQLVKVI
jgi:ribosomal protein S18 acetylase RimI-like enzyme